jgi:hypothetical protein
MAGVVAVVLGQLILQKLPLWVEQVAAVLALAFLILIMRTPLHQDKQTPVEEEVQLLVGLVVLLVRAQRAEAVLSSSVIPERYSIFLVELFTFLTVTLFILLPQVEILLHYHRQFNLPLPAWNYLLLVAEAEVVVWVVVVEPVVT